MSLDNLLGHTLDHKYLIERELGKGGMGAVYFATHLGTERPVAVKVIVPELMQREEFVERFRREARAAGRLRHPNVVDVTDFGVADTDGGRVAYLVMEYLDGCTLGEILTEEKQLPLSWTLDIVEQTCSAVQEAHEQGIIHRDLKPDNIWLEPNQRGGYTVKVLDFGIAKLESAAVSTVDQESLSGTEAPALIERQETEDRASSETLAGSRKTQILGGGDGNTLISEADTIADVVAGTLVAEGATIIQPLAGVDSEGGTVILSDNKKTQVLEAPDQATKVLSQGGGSTTENIAAPRSAELTRVGSVLGTPLYMSPEQCSGKKLDPRSDIYSLAVITYQMLSGKPPFDGQFTEVMEAHKEKSPPTLVAKGVPRKVKKVIHSALAKGADERPASAEAFVSQLRASSEGIGELLRKGLVMYSQHLLTFLLTALLVSLPMATTMLIKAAFNLGKSTGVIEDFSLATVVSGVLGVATFFIQIFTAAFLVGMITWIVAQILAVPLRPVNVKFAFREARSKWKPLFLTVTLSTIGGMAGWVVGAIVGVVLAMIVAVPLYTYVSTALGVVLGILIAGLASIGLGLYISGKLMLVTPSMMIEGVTGVAAFRRSAELTKRSLRTVIGIAFFAYFAPAVLAIFITVAIGGIVKTFTPLDEPVVKKSETTQNDVPHISLSTDQSGVKIGDVSDKDLTAEQKKKIEKRQTITGSIFEIFWIPFSVVLMSFSSVITALLYFKTRQAGGESMMDLLAKFESVDRPQSNWQQKVRNRLIQSGRQTSNPS